MESFKSPAQTCCYKKNSNARQFRFNLSFNIQRTAWHRAALCALLWAFALTLGVGFNAYAMNDDTISVSDFVPLDVPFTYLDEVYTHQQKSTKVVLQSTDQGKVIKKAIDYIEKAEPSAALEAFHLARSDKKTLFLALNKSSTPLTGGHGETGFDPLLKGRTILSTLSPEWSGVEGLTGNVITVATQAPESKIIRTVGHEHVHHGIKMVNGSFDPCVVPGKLVKTSENIGSLERAVFNDIKNIGITDISKVTKEHPELLILYRYPQETAKDFLVQKLKEGGVCKNKIPELLSDFDHAYVRGLPSGYMVERIVKAHPYVGQEEVHSLVRAVQAVRRAEIAAHSGELNLVQDPSAVSKLAPRSQEVLNQLWYDAKKRTPPLLNDIDLSAGGSGKTQIMTCSGVPVLDEGAFSTKSTVASFVNATDNSKFSAKTSPEKIRPPLKAKVISNVLPFVDFGLHVGFEGLNQKISQGPFEWSTIGDKILHGTCDWSKAFEKGTLKFISELPAYVPLHRLLYKVGSWPLCLGFSGLEVAAHAAPPLGQVYKDECAKFNHDEFNSLPSLMAKKEYYDNFNDMHPFARPDTLMSSYMQKGLLVPSKVGDRILNGLEKVFAPVDGVPFMPFYHGSVWDEKSKKAQEQEQAKKEAPQEFKPNLRDLRWQEVRASMVPHELNYLLTKDLYKEQSVGITCPQPKSILVSDNEWSRGRSSLNNDFTNVPDYGASHASKASLCNEVPGKVFDLAFKYEPLAGEVVERPDEDPYFDESDEIKEGDAVQANRPFELPRKFAAFGAPVPELPKVTINFGAVPGADNLVGPSINIRDVGGFDINVGVGTDAETIKTLVGRFCGSTDTHKRVTIFGKQYLWEIKSSGSGFFKRLTGREKVAYIDANGEHYKEWFTLHTQAFNDEKNKSRIQAAVQDVLSRAVSDTIKIELKRVVGEFQTAFSNKEFDKCEGILTWLKNKYPGVPGAKAVTDQWESALDYVKTSKKLSEAFAQNNWDQASVLHELLSKNTFAGDIKGQLGSVALAITNQKTVATTQGAINKALGQGDHAGVIALCQEFKAKHPELFDAAGMGSVQHWSELHKGLTHALSPDGFDLANIIHYSKEIESLRNDKDSQDYYRSLREKSCNNAIAVALSANNWQAVKLPASQLALEAALNGKEDQSKYFTDLGKEADLRIELAKVMDVPKGVAPNYVTAKDIVTQLEGISRSEEAKKHWQEYHQKLVNCQKVPDYVDAINTGSLALDIFYAMVGPCMPKQEGVLSEAFTMSKKVHSNFPKVMPLAVQGLWAKYKNETGAWKLVAQEIFSDVTRNVSRKPCSVDEFLATSDFVSKLMLSLPITTKMEKRMQPLLKLARVITSTAPVINAVKAGKYITLAPKVVDATFDLAGTLLLDRIRCEGDLYEQPFMYLLPDLGKLAVVGVINNFVPNSFLRSYLGIQGLTTATEIVVSNTCHHKALEALVSNGHYHQKKGDYEKARACAAGVNMWLHRLNSWTNFVSEGNNWPDVPPVYKSTDPKAVIKGKVFLREHRVASAFKSKQWSQVLELTAPALAQDGKMMEHLEGGDPIEIWRMPNAILHRCAALLNSNDLSHLEKFLSEVHYYQDTIAPLIRKHYGANSCQQFQEGLKEYRGKAAEVFMKIAHAKVFGDVKDPAKEALESVKNFMKTNKSFLCQSGDRSALLSLVGLCVYLKETSQQEQEQLHYHTYAQELLANFDKQVANKSESESDNIRFMREKLGLQLHGRTVDLSFFTSLVETARREMNLDESHRQHNSQLLSMALGQLAGRLKDKTEAQERLEIVRALFTSADALPVHHRSVDDWRIIAYSLFECKKESETQTHCYLVLTNALYMHALKNILEHEDMKKYELDTEHEKLLVECNREIGALKGSQAIFREYGYDAESITQRLEKEGFIGCLGL